jgi:hypothetical protein
MSKNKDKDLAVQELGIIEDSITLNPLDLEKADTWEDFLSLWMMSKEIDVRNQWFKGDIANRVAVVHGESSLSQFSQDVQEKRVTIESYRRVARAFPKETRIYNLNWTHYFIASFTDSFKKGEGKFETENRFEWIEKANDQNWSTSRLGMEIKKNGALVEKKQEISQYYDEYLDKVKYVLLHIEKDQLSEKEADQLLDKLMAIYNDFTIYLDTTKKLSS